MLRYPDTVEARIALAEAAREIHRLCQEAQTGNGSERLIREIVVQVDALLELCSQSTGGSRQAASQRS